MNLILMSIVLWVSTHTIEPEPVQKDEKISVVQIELTEEGELKPYYVDYTYERNGKFKQWNTKIIYLNDN